MNRAIVLSPDYASGHEAYGWVLALSGRLDEAKEKMKRAQWLDPISPRVNCGLSMALLWTGNVDEALKQLRKALSGANSLRQESL